MKKIIASFIATLIITTAFAGNPKITVSSGENGTDPLYFSYIKHHGKTVAVTDSMGIALLKNITIGDTITASYIGMAPGKAVYEGQDEMMFFLKDIESSNSREVLAKYDVMKVYKKNTLKIGVSYNSMQDYVTDARVKMNIMKDGKYQRVEGNMKYRGWLSFNLRKLRRGVMPQTELTTANDTTGVLQYINIATIGAIECANAAVVGQFAVRHQYMPIGVKYLGVKNGNKVFRFNIDASAMFEDSINNDTTKQLKHMDSTTTKEMLALKNLKLQLIGHFNDKKAPVRFDVAATADSVDLNLVAEFKLMGKKLFTLHHLELTKLSSEIRMSNGDYMTIDFGNIRTGKSKYKFKKPESKVTVTVQKNKKD